MNFEKTHLEGLVHIQPAVYGDERGSFFEFYNKKKTSDLFNPEEFVQDNISTSEKGVLRGLHIQPNFPQGKLVTVLEGEVFDVAVDLRVSSPTFGKWYGVYLSSKNNSILWIPRGFAHGFVVVSKRATFLYKCDQSYNPKDECSVIWNDPEIAIEWPESQPILSAKDVEGISLSEFRKKRLDSSNAEK